MKNYGRTSVYEFMGDFIVYRNLAPVDSRLPSLAALGPEVGLPEGITPRKSQPEYARVMAQLLRRGRALDAPAASIERHGPRPAGAEGEFPFPVAARGLCGQPPQASVELRHEHRTARDRTERV